jgi:hypothetical protein
MLLALSSCEHGALAPRAPFLSAGSGGGEKKVEEAAPAAEKASATFRRISQRTVCRTPGRHTSAGAREAGMEFPQVEPNTSDPIDLGEAGRLLCELGFFNKGYGPGTKLEVLQIDMPVGKVRTREELLELGRKICDRGFALRMVPDPAHPGKPELRADPLIGMEMYPHGQLGSWNDGQSSQANHRLRPSDENSPTKAETFGEEFYYKVVLKQSCWTFDNKASAAILCVPGGGQIALGAPKVGGKQNGENFFCAGDALSRVGPRPDRPSAAVSLKADPPASPACSRHGAAMCPGHPVASALRR